MTPLRAAAYVLLVGLAAILVLAAMVPLWLIVR